MTALQQPSPYQTDAPWPCMRADLRNTGRSPFLDSGAVEGPVPVRRWSTGNGIFSTPIVGADETIYVGSADKLFYAFDPLSGKQRWSFRTGECIDSAGCIARDDTVYFVSCDAGLYGLRPDGEESWRLNLFENRKHFTPSTIFWWEGNVVLGPNGWLYAGNDDFNFYAIEPRQGVRWAYLTGLHIWTAPAFGDDGSVHFLSFDRYCYKLDAQTGRVRWKTNTGNFVVSSPAIGDGGHVFFGSFDARVYSLDGESGRIRWRAPTGGPIYGSPALAGDGTLYVGSSDGCLYALDSVDGRELWSFYTGDAVRASASLGPDPERQSPYLVYFGSGNGRLYCVDPNGRRRWSFNTVSEGSELDSPNINASIALGRSGVVAATASGHVFYVPYHHYLTSPEDPGLERRADDGYPESGTFLYTLTPGGVMADDPLRENARSLTAEPSQPISLRLLARENGRTRPARFDADGVEVAIDPPRPHRVTLQPDRGQLNVIPEATGQASDDASVTVRARYRIDGGSESRARSPDPREDRIEARLDVRAVPAADAPRIETLAEMPFRITHMSIYDPPIVPSFDQIGIASLTIQARVVHVDPETGRFVAWGLKKFGIAEDGDAVQIAIPRHLFYAFRGTYRNGRLAMTARDCNFELTAFPAPLDSLRFAGTWEGAEGPRVGSSLIAELDVANRFRLFSGRKRFSEPTAGSTLPWSQIGAFARQWMPDLGAAVRSLPSFFRVLARTLPLTARLLQRQTYGPWGLIGEDGWFRGVGSFRSRADTPLDAAAVERTRLVQDGDKLVAQIVARPEAERSLDAAIPGIVVVSMESHEPLQIRYDAATRIIREPGRVRVELSLPASVRSGRGRWKAIALLDVTPLGETVL